MAKMTEKQKEKALIIKSIYSVLLTNNMAYSIGMDACYLIRLSDIYSFQIKGITNKLNSLLMDYDVSLIKILKDAVAFMGDIGNTVDDMFGKKVSDLRVEVINILKSNNLPERYHSPISEIIIGNMFLSNSIDNVRNQIEILNKMNIVDEKGRKLDTVAMFSNLNLKEALRQSGLLVEQIYKKFGLQKDIIADCDIQKTYKKICKDLLMMKTIKHVIKVAEENEKKNKINN